MLLASPAALLTPLSLSCRRLEANKNVCPLCSRSRINATVAPTGFVFCYSCILLHVRENGDCPITHRPIEEAQLFKLFVDD